MARDSRTEAIFTTADDQMQGLWGLHRYLKAATDTIEPELLLNNLPKDIFRLTHEWGRSYDRKEMAAEVCQMRDFLLSRQSLVALVTICEAALLRLNDHLATLGKYSAVKGAEKRLRWAFAVVQNSPSGSKEAIARLPKTSGDLDNGRRLRNCIVHRNGCYDPELYCQKAVIQDGWVVPQFEKDADRSVKAQETIFLTTERFEYFTHSHVEFLHILHNTIQKNEFGHPYPYNYADESKRIEWHRILSGRRAVGM